MNPVYVGRPNPPPSSFNGSFEVPTVKDFKEYFQRDFPFGCSESEVMDSDILKAFLTASVEFNVALCTRQAQFTTLFLLLSAHFMVTALRNSAQGVSGVYSWLTGSKSVGSVSASQAIPQRILDNPSMAMLAQTSYGALYLQLILPQLAGNVGSVHGRIHP